MMRAPATYRFEQAFAGAVGARYGIAMTNGTVTLEVGLRAMGVQLGDTVITTPLTMAATTMAILNVGAVPEYRDIDPDTWLLSMDGIPAEAWVLPVSLYGLSPDWPANCLDDAAQTLRSHTTARMTSYSFQRSKILSTGEGGMLCTNDEALATLARSLGSLGYELPSDRSRIKSADIKHPTAIRHHRSGMNTRMNDVTAELGLRGLQQNPSPIDLRANAAALYRRAVINCPHVVMQHVPEGVTHQYWAFTIAVESPQMWDQIAQSVVKHGGEAPYGAWRLTYNEPAFRHLTPSHTVPHAEELQPRLMQFQTNDLVRATANAIALERALLGLYGTPIVR